MGYGPWAIGRTLLLLTAAAATAQAAELGAADVTVRIYHAGVVTEADETGALRTAAGILAAADVVPHWTHCHKGAAPDDACARPLAPGELTLRLVRARQVATQMPAMTLGEALLPAQRGAPTLATVHVDRVDWLAERSGTDAKLLLGRAMAHELTHLLTGIGAHAAEGLMRPVWSLAELSSEHREDWMLDGVNVAAIRARANVTMVLVRR